MQNQGNSKLVAGVVAVLVVAAGIFGLTTFKSKENVVVKNDEVPTTPATTTEPVATSVPPADTTKQTVKYKDGTYTATGSYMSPGGMDRLGVTLTLKNDIVTSVSATAMAGDKTSDKYQDMFIAGFKTLVVGKNIDSVELHVVSGSSLTSGGFNDAVAKIKVQAKA